MSLTFVGSCFRYYLMFLGALAMIGYRWNGLINFPRLITRMSR